MRTSNNVFSLTGSTGDMRVGDVDYTSLTGGSIRSSNIVANNGITNGEITLGKTGIFVESGVLPSSTSNNYLVWAGKTGGGKAGAANQIGYRIGTSRRETKYDINPITQELVDGINQLQPVTYIYKADEEKQTIGGFIAEEVAEVSPLFAKWGPNYKISESGSIEIDNVLDDTSIPSDINDRAILAAAVAKIQQLEKEINQLKAKIT